MLRWFLADLRTGRQILDLPVLSGRGQRFLNRPESLECTIDLRDPDVIALNVQNTATAAKAVLACAEGDVILGAGPIWVHDLDATAATLTLQAKGVWSYYDHRHVLPLIAATTPLTEFTIPDPANDGGTMPNPALKTSLSGFELGTIAKKLVQQAHLWPGGALPIVFEADRTGPADEGHTRNFEGIEFKQLGDVIGQLTEVEGGPDIRFLPRFTADKLGIEWLLQTGTEAKPLLASMNTYRWDVSAPESQVSDLRVNVNASEISGLAWATGGRVADEALVARASDSRLVNAGFALFESMDATHQSVSVQATLDAYAAEQVKYGLGATETWSFTVEADQQPFLGSYFEGDFVDMDVAPYDPTTGAGDPYFQAGGTFHNRIVSMSWDAETRVVKIDCVPKVVV